MSCLNLSKIDPSAVVEELFDLSKPGALGWNEVLDLEVCQRIVSAAETVFSRGDSFVTPQRERGQVIQEMQISYLERLQNIPQEYVETISPVIQNFEIFYQKLVAAGAEFDSQLRNTYQFGSNFNSIGIHRYPAGTAGITPHKDFKSSRNLIVIFVLSGDGKLYRCKNRKGEEPVLLADKPGSMVILRAARNDKEQKLRPFHYLTGPSIDRYSLILRQEQGKAGEGYA